MPALFFQTMPEDTTFDGVYVLDTNVWLVIYGPYMNPQEKRTKSYSAILKKILDDGGTIIADPIIIEL